MANGADEPKLVQSVTAHFLSGKSFEDVGKDPGEWQSTAQKLKMSSDILMPTDSVHESLKKAIMSGFAQEATREALRNFGAFCTTQLVSLMLLGMSFECLLKGLIVSSDPSLVLNQNLDEKIGTHNLESLANLLSNRGGIALDQSEKSLIHPLLSDLVIWGGRYPIPRQQNALVEKFSHSSQEMKAISALWMKLDSELKAKIVPPAQGTPP